MLCKHCGATVEEDNLFCPECGNRCEEEPVQSEQGTELPAEPEAGAEEGEVFEVPVIPVVAQSVSSPQETAPAQPKPEKKAIKRKKPHFLIRMLMQLISLVLCVVLLVAVLGTVVLADLNTLTSSGGINKLISSVLNPKSAPASPRITVGALGVHLDDPTFPGDLEDALGGTIPGDLEDALGGTIPGDWSDILGGGDLEIEIPSDILTGGSDAVGELIDYIFVQVEQQTGEELPITSEQLQTIVEESTVTEFISEKLEGYANDFLNGTTDTKITAEEILQLLEENQELLERELDLEITEEFKQEFTQTVDQIIVENDINNVIHEGMNTVVNDMIQQNTESLGGLSYDEIRQIIAFVSSDRLLYVAIGLCAVLFLLLCLANWYNVPGGLSWAAWPCITVGLVLSAPIYILQDMPQMVQSLTGPEFAMAIQAVSSFVSVLAPIHYGLLFTGLGLLVISIIWRIIRAAVWARRRKLAAAA